MRFVILGMCALVATGVFIAMFLAIWSTRRAPAAQATFRQSAATELVWAAIPCLMILAAAIPAIIGIISTHGGN